MSLRRARAIAYGVVALLAAAAIFFSNPLPTRATRPAAEVLTAAHVEHRWRERNDTLGKGDNLMALLARGGLSDAIAREAIKAAKSLDFRRIPPNLAVRVRSDVNDSIPSEITLQLAVDKFLHLKRDSVGWKEEVEQVAWVMDTIVISGDIAPNRSNLYLAMDSAAVGALPRSARYRLVNLLAEDIFEYRVDMSRDLRVGDRFRVVAQRSRLPAGLTRIDTVIAAAMTLSGKTTEAVRFRSQKVLGLYFDQDGKPMRSGFLRSPLRFSRITSRFGMRMHPILGTMRAHQGTDYGATSGTPIRAIGDGVVIRAGWHNGYGNVVDIRHAKGYVSRYGHMKGFGPGIHAGARVNREQTIGYVGSTGLSTAPHLHFEVHVNGVQRNPGAVLANVSADPVPASERVAFADAHTRAQMLLAGQPLLASTDAGGARQAGAQRQ
jgi:murein DD-endopeptidase MepM/ murein hydrolase activator NlpD